MKKGYGRELPRESHRWRCRGGRPNRPQAPQAVVARSNSCGRLWDNGHSSRVCPLRRGILRTNLKEGCQVVLNLPFVPYVYLLQVSLFVHQRLFVLPTSHLSLLCRSLLLCYPSGTRVLDWVGNERMLIVNRICLTVRTTCAGLKTALHTCHSGTTEISSSMIIPKSGVWIGLWTGALGTPEAGRPSVFTRLTLWGTLKLNHNHAAKQGWVI